AEIIDAFAKMTGRGMLCNQPASGTAVIEEFGAQHMQTGALIVYTSADSVFQIAAHEDIVPPEQLYEYCRMARKLLTGEHGVGRVIARPFIGTPGNFTRTARRHDFSIEPPADTMLDLLTSAGLDTIAVGKINDIFAGRGITRVITTAGNDDGMEKTSAVAAEDFRGLCFVNLVDFDSSYGHRNNPAGYGEALTRFDRWLGGFLAQMRPDDMLIITADHGCDPSTPSTDHSREYVPLLICGDSITPKNRKTLDGFYRIAATVSSAFGLSHPWGESLI
ncbi:MAG: phosphopentomutase, partial [Clostridia bacterium]|nr:phosphopentomutase [Clostridia bacterium]